MTKHLFCALQEQIGWTGKRLAETIGVSPLAITRYRQGHVAIPGPVQFAMRALASGYRPGK